MAERTSSQLDWEQGYLDKVQRINEILHQEQLSLLQLRSQAVVSDTGTLSKLINGVKNFFTGDAGTDAVAGEYSLPSTIKVATVSGGKITIPTGQRTPYHKARDLAAKESNYAGFRSISEDMYTFPGIEEENIFAPDFIPILALIHTKVSSALGVDKIKLNSGTRKKAIDVEWDAHMGGYAIDMGLTGKDRYTAADICWELGLRGVAVGQTFIHVDAGPDPVVGWNYTGVPTYRGPSSAR